VDFLSLVAMPLVAIGMAYAFWTVNERMKNLDAAWEHRKRIAVIASKIEHDPNAPEEVLRYISKIADHAFDDRLFRTLENMPKTEVRTRSGLKVSLSRRYGDQYGDLLYNALSELTFVVLLSDRKWARIVHHVKSVKDLKSEKKSLMKSILEWVHGSDNDASHSHHAHAL